MTAAQDAELPVVVVGGGISGLAAAWALTDGRFGEPARRVIVLEAAGDVGGKLRGATVAGVQVDVGAEAMLVRRPEGLRLAEAAGLAPIAPLTTSAQLRAGGRLHPLPARTVMGIPSDVEALRASGAVSDGAIGKVEAEPELPALEPLDGDVAIGGLVRSRLGNEITDRLVEPLLGGVYAGRADRLSLRAAIPALAAELASGGSLVRAAQAVAGRAVSSTAPVFASFAGGLARLPRALADSGRFEVRTGVTVRSISLSAHGYHVDCGAVPASERIDASAVVVATPAAKASRLLAAVAPAAGAELAAIESASMAIVTLALPGDVPLPAGSGLLVAAKERLTTKGVTISSQKWPLQTGGLTLVRASIGRVGDEAILQREDEELITLASADLGQLLGVRPRPVDSLVTRWGGGLPQYGVGHVDRVARVRRAVAEVPGLAVCGAYLDGLGVPACIGAGEAAAAAVAAHLAAGPTAASSQAPGAH